MNDILSNRPGRMRPLRLATVACCCTLAIVTAGPARAQSGRDKGAGGESMQMHADAGRADFPRSTQDVARDAGEKPAAIALFANIQPRMRVADLRARDGYLTEVLALAAYPYGRIFADNDPDGFADAQDWRARLDKPILADTARFDLSLASPLAAYVANLDVVISAGAYADAIRRNIDRDAMNATVMRALHPGGLYVISDARAADDAVTLCRVTEATVRAEVERAGFRFVESSDALKEPADDHGASACQSAHGQSLDRFLLKFEKPASAPAASPEPGSK